jgi:hypothetical protein
MTTTVEDEFLDTGDGRVTGKMTETYVRKSLAGGRVGPRSRTTAWARVHPLSGGHIKQRPGTDPCERLSPMLASADDGV